MEEDKKIYIGNLDFDMSEEELQAAIEAKGIQVKELKIIKDKFTDKSKGFGFAEFETPELAQQAIDALNGQDLNGRALRVSKAQKMKPRGDNFGPNRGNSNSRFSR